MSSAPLQTFKEVFESLAGKVHLIDGMDEAASAVAGVLEGASATRVALAQLPGEVEAGIERYCSERHIEVVKPPFNGATVLEALAGAQVGISGAAFAVADMGALVEVTRDDGARLVSALPRVHVAVIHADNILPTLLEAASQLRDVFTEHLGDCTATFISGPSRTGDIEMKITLGVHGPAEAHAVVIAG